MVTVRETTLKAKVPDYTYSGRYGSSYPNRTVLLPKKFLL